MRPFSKYKNENVPQLWDETLRDNLGTRPKPHSINMGTFVYEKYAHKTLMLTKNGQ